MDRFAKALRDSVALKEAIADDLLVASKADLRSLPAPASKRAPPRQHNVRVNDRLRPRRTLTRDFSLHRPAGGTLLLLLQKA